MSFPFKLIVPSAVALYLAAACTPDLNSLCADTSCNADTYTVNRNSAAGTGGDSAIDPGDTGGTDSVGGSAPATPVCENGKKDSNESDVDCGGSSKCDRCVAGSKCTANRDCASSICTNGICTDPSCKDKIKNQDETGVDCGGHCLPCDVGVACTVNDDCSGQYCADNKCSDHCLSQVREADETDVDCGGSTCKQCDDTKHCGSADDCKSHICSNNLCAVATCSDQVQNQDESDKDCGGVCSATKPCAVAQKCNSEADCASWICTSSTKKCAADTVGATLTADAVIDDFEDGDFNLPPLGTPVRVGNWYPFSDGSGVTTYDVAIINRGASVKGLHTTGKNFSSWGSGVGVDLAHSSGDKLTWDASAYTGITFWARAVLTGTSTLSMTVALPDIDTDGLVKDKTCTTCDHHYLKTVTLSNAWQRIGVDFRDLVLEAGGAPTPTAFKPSALASVQFRFNPGTTYEVFIDDIAFVK
jgi:hypothetical protein